MIKTVIKRDGSRQPFAPEKLVHWAKWADEKLGLDWKEIAEAAYRKCIDGCRTSDLQQAMIEACVVDNASTAHQLFAGRLFIGNVYHELYGDKWSIPSVKEQHDNLADKGVVERLHFTEEQWEEINSIIEHKRDLGMKYSQHVQISKKYVLRDVNTGKLFETPQFAFIRMAMWYASKLDKEDQVKTVKEIYELLSSEVLCSPTPDYLYIGTPHGSSPSCVVVRCEDSLNSLSAMLQTVWACSANGSGIGVSLELRSPLDPVAGNTIQHAGKHAYYKAVDALAKANKQAGRAGAVTIHYTCLDPEVVDIARWKNPTTPPDVRLADLDFSFGSNAAFADAVREDSDWMLVSCYYAPKLWELLYQPDKELFKAEYERVKADESIPKKWVKARYILHCVLRESVETRQYEHFTDEMNRHTPFKDTIYSSNLCQEVTLPTRSYENGIDDLNNPDADGEIATCNLMGINVATVNNDPELYYKAAYYSLLMCRLKILHGSYPFESMKRTSIARMNAGVSMISLAHLMAKHGMKYSSMFGKKFVHRLAELHSFSLHKAALEIGKKYGLPEWIGKTKYPDGWLPIDTRNEYATQIAHQPLKQDWEELRKEIIAAGGIGFSVLETMVPSESSSQAQNATNGLYPIREGVIEKKDATKKSQWVAPEFEELKEHYEIAWTISEKDMLDIYAIVQCFTGQGISSDLYLTHASVDGKIQVSGKKMIQGFLHRQKAGLKSRYYFNHNTNGVYNQQEGVKCGSGGCEL